MALTTTLRRDLLTEHPILSTIVGLQVLFLLIPTLIVLFISFGAGERVSFPPGSYTLRWYLELPAQSTFVTAFWRSLVVAVLCTALSIPIGVLCALGLIRYRIRFRTTIQLYLLLPFTIPLVVSGIVLFLLFGRANLLGSLWPVALALTIINIPFMIWSVSARVNALDPSIEHAAKSLGAEEIQTFTYVTFPLILPGVITGAFMMFILALNEFLVSLLVTTHASRTLPVALYTSIRGGISPEIAAVASIYVIVAIVAVLVADRLIDLDEFLHS